MSKLLWPYTEYDTGSNPCVICQVPVPQTYDEIQRHWHPISLYWNSERHEVYCTPEHSLKRHEEIHTPSAPEQV